MEPVKAIPTHYAGVRFRSRLEARWAVCFDVLGIPWEYEPEKIDLGATRFIPDFRLYGDVWAEVKPALRVEEQHARIAELRAYLVKWGHFLRRGESLLALFGVPESRMYPVLRDVHRHPGYASQEFEDLTFLAVTGLPVSDRRHDWPLYRPDLMAKAVQAARSAFRAEARH